MREGVVGRGGGWKGGGEVLMQGIAIDELNEQAENE